MREGFKDVAECFQREAGIQQEIDTSIMGSQIEIRKAIETGNVQKAVETVNDLDAVILDTNPQLFFHLQLQQLLEYIREGNIEQALVYAQNELSARGEENSKFLDELESSLALLAYDDTSKSPFAYLLQHSQRLKIVSELNAAILSHHGKEEVSSLSVLMKLVHWAQNSLDKKGVEYPKLTDICTGTISQSTISTDN